MAAEKRAILTGQLAILCFAISLFFTFVDISTGYNESFLLYILLTLFGVLTYLLNWFQYHALAKIVLIIGANLIIFTAYEAEGLATGSFAFFISSIVASFAIFGYENRSKALFLSIFSVIVFLVSTAFEFSWVEKAEFSPEDERIYFVANFSIIKI